MIIKILIVYVFLFLVGYILQRKYKLNYNIFGFVWVYDLINVGINGNRWIYEAERDSEEYFKKYKKPNKKYQKVA